MVMFSLGGARSVRDLNCQSAAARGSRVMAESQWVRMVFDC